MSITSGNIGDIIAIGRVAWELARALTGRGSAKEYQGLVKELEAFDKALLEVAALWQNREPCPELEALVATTRDAVKDLRATLLAFRLKIDKKYGTSLCAAGSGKWLKDASKKVLWLKEKKDVLELRRRLHLASETLTVSMVAAMAKSNRLASSAQAQQVELLHGSLQESTRSVSDQMAQLRLMDEKLDAQAATSNRILSVVTRGVTHIKDIHSIVVDMGSVLTLLNNNIISLQGIHRGLGTQWKQEPVTLEDALGRHIRLPLELIDSWETLDMNLIKRFEKHSGHNKIQRREYVIEEGSTGRALSRATDLKMCLSPGQKIDMSVVFLDRAGDSNYCPRCRTKSATSSGDRTRCTSCKMWFQRVTEVDEVENDVVEGTSAGVTQVHQLYPRLTGPDVEPAVFQRVRMLQKITVPLSDSGTSECPHAAPPEDINTASPISISLKAALEPVDETESAIQDTDRLSTSGHGEGSDSYSISAEHERPQKATLEERNTALPTSMPSKDGLDIGQASRIQDIPSLSTSSPDDDSYHPGISPVRGYTKDGRPTSINLQPIQNINIKLSNIMSSKNTLYTRQESIIPSSNMTLNSTRGEDLYGVHVTPNPGRSEHKNWNRKLGHRHGSHKSHLCQSTNQAIVLPEYRWEWFWSCDFCQEHSAMSTFIRDCPGCFHARCENCPMESVKIRVRR